MFHSYSVHSMLCRQMDFSSSWYQIWREEISNGSPKLEPEMMPVWGVVWDGMKNRRTMHRKLWEWCVIAQALDERGFLQNGRRGIGFAVGKEPLSSLFALRGVGLIASDFISEGTAQQWLSTGQMGNSLEAIHWPGIISFEEFRTKVQFSNIDMRDISQVPRGAFDFSWSSCAIEHLGSLEAGFQFADSILKCNA